jgi:hypothetical protein
MEMKSGTDNELNIWVTYEHMGELGSRMKREFRGRS